MLQQLSIVDMHEIDTKLRKRPRKYIHMISWSKIIAMLSQVKQRWRHLIALLLEHWIMPSIRQSYYFALDYEIGSSVRACHKWS